MNWHSHIFYLLVFFVHLPAILMCVCFVCSHTFWTKAHWLICTCVCSIHNVLSYSPTLRNSVGLHVSIIVLTRPNPLALQALHHHVVNETMLFGKCLPSQTAPCTDCRKERGEGVESECGGVSCGVEKRGWMESLFSRQNVQLAPHMYIHIHVLRTPCTITCKKQHRLLALCSLYIIL